MRVRVGVCVRTVIRCRSLCASMRTYVGVCLRVCVCVRVCMCVRVCVCVCVCVCTCVYNICECACQFMMVYYYGFEMSEPHVYESAC